MEKPDKRGEMIQLLQQAQDIAEELEDGATGYPIVTFAQEPNGGLIVIPHTVIGPTVDRIAALAARDRLPCILPYRFWMAMNGGLMSYGIDVVDLFQKGGAYVDRILRGAKPSDLPVQNPTKFELVINLKTATALSLTVPPTLLASADELIE